MNRHSKTSAKSSRSALAASLIAFRKTWPLAFLTAILVLLLLGLDKNTHPRNSDLVGKYIRTDLLLDGNFEPMQLKSCSLIHIYTEYCRYCHKDRILMDSMRLKEHIDVIGIKWRDNPSGTDIGRLEPNPYTRLGFVKESDFFVELGVHGVPQTVLVGKDGKILYSRVGAMDQNIIENEIINTCSEHKHN